jgi:HK97 family phage major capsid protein
MSGMQYLKEYLDTAKGTEGSLLIVKKIHDTLIAEVDKNLIPRSEAALLITGAMIPGSSYDIDLEAENKMDVRKIAEGAEIWLDQDEYTSVNIKPLKYGVAIRITREMMEDAKWDLLARNVAKAGKRMAENETNLILTEVAANAANTVAGGASITIANITRAIQYLDDADYTASTILVGNEVMYDLRNIDTFVEYQKVGNTDMLAKGFIGTIYGLKVLKFSTNAAPSTTYSKYAVVFDSSEAYAIAEKRAVTVENFDLPTFDMSGACITQRIAVKTLRSNAIALITTS